MIISRSYYRHITITSLSLIFLVLFPSVAFSYKIFIYRPFLDKKPFSQAKRITVHGEFFGQLQLPSTFPSFNDLSGPDDRWTFGFQNIIFLTENTSLLAQLVTHDDGGKRTKFDWHFSLRQNLLENLVMIIGHDSNHDSDYQSILNGKSFYVNRNYIGLGIPIEYENFYLEAFTWFFHHTNQPGHLDLSGDILRQEYGLRAGYILSKSLIMSLQLISQSEAYFSVGQAVLGDLICRIRVFDFLEITLGGSFWKDIQLSRLRNKKTFYKLIWGLAVPF